MKKYIDADKLIAEIEKWRDKAKEKYNESTYSMGRCDALAEFRNHIVSLQQEQPEVDLEKELYEWRHKHFKGKRDGDHSGEYLERESQLDLARHFYELELNARKEEMK